MPGASSPATSFRFNPAENASPAPVTSTGRPSASRTWRVTSCITAVLSAFLPGPSIVSM